MTQIQSTRLYLTMPAPFDFKAAAYSHGWVVLAPNSWEEARGAMQRVERLVDGEVVLLELHGAGSEEKPRISIGVEHRGTLSKAARAEIKAGISRMFRREEDFSEFYAACRARGGHWLRLTKGLGRLQRSPTLFEDVVKTICTTNIQWSGTKSMTRNLVNALGAPFPGDRARKAFPTPDTVAAASPELLAEARLGYRGPYVKELAERVVSGELDLEALRDPTIPLAELKKRLLAIKGVGNYAAHTLMMILGYYGELAFDTALRDFVAKRYMDGKTPTEEDALAIYQDWGKWKYLAYWFDLWEEVEPEEL